MNVLGIQVQSGEIPVDLLALVIGDRSSGRYGQDGLAEGCGDEVIAVRV